MAPISCCSTLSAKCGEWLALLTLDDESVPCDCRNLTKACYHSSLLSPLLLLSSSPLLSSPLLFSPLLSLLSSPSSPPSSLPSPLSSLPLSSSSPLLSSPSLSPPLLLLLPLSLLSLLASSLLPLVLLLSSHPLSLLSSSPLLLLSPPLPLLSTCFSLSRSLLKALLADAVPGCAHPACDLQVFVHQEGRRNQRSEQQVPIIYN